MGHRNPALERLDALLGRWNVQPQVDGVGPAWSEFTWEEDGAFLRQFTDREPGPDTAGGWGAHAPFPTVTLIGLDDAGEEFTVLYADARGVYRVYRMTFDGALWRMWRDAPGFNQRFTGTLSGDRIDARWELSKDGAVWDLDFALTYTRLR
ncbi:hypothetical protein [Nonomuraea sp. SBT364]|uniref:hypothetical protein n=1 Tax=Nonomuraea sp. SBT364 TaxID=1580530 RepID=UPI00066B40FB|nr:hypothetical protein [Nonomuraea sp. SBT364]